MSAIACPRCGNEWWILRCADQLRDDTDVPNPDPRAWPTPGNPTSHVEAVLQGKPIPGGGQPYVAERRTLYVCEDCDFPFRDRR